MARRRGFHDRPQKPQPLWLAVVTAGIPLAARQRRPDTAAIEIALRSRLSDSDGCGMWAGQQNRSKQV
jgi:hypothetical protein